MLQDDPIIVIGMGSSGTRLVVQILEALGVFMGGKYAENEFKEPIFFYNELHNFTDYFRYAYPIPDDWQDKVNMKKSKIVSFVEKRLEYLYRKSGYRSGRWGFKDPRNTIVLPIYLELFPKSQILHVIRDGRDVALSKTKEIWDCYGPRDEKTWFYIWEQYVSIGRSYASSFNDQYFEIRYEDICELTSKAISLLADLTANEEEKVRRAIRLTLKKPHLKKWLKCANYFKFAKDSILLRELGYPVD